MPGQVIRYGARSVTFQYTLGVPPESVTHEDFLAFPAGAVRDLLSAEYADQVGMMSAFSEAGLTVSILWSRGEVAGAGLFVAEPTGPEGEKYPTFQAGGSSSIPPELWATVKFALPYSASE